nr:MAG TPA: hypothetical protein [Caudoviricetes sp.]
MCHYIACQLHALPLRLASVPCLAFAPRLKAVP